MPESVAIVDGLIERGVAVYCLSNMRARSLAYIRGRFDFLQKFRGMVASCEVGLLKPERAIYDHLTARYQIAPSATLFIDDHRPNVEGARQAGLQAILFRSAADCRRQLNELAPSIRL
jgi:2-haloacid dehalogenase